MEGKVALHNEIKCMPELYLKPDEKMVMNKDEQVKGRKNEVRKPNVLIRGLMMNCFLMNYLLNT